MKSVHTRIEAARKLQGSDQVWALIRILRRFTFKDLAGESSVHKDTIRSYLAALIGSGHLEIDGDGYWLMRDVGVDRPRVRKDGSEVPQTGRDRAWMGMKMMSVFTVRDLVATCGVAESDAKDYALGLHHAGILVVVEAARPGVATKFSLPRHANTGWKAPSLRRDGSVLDRNTGKVYPRTDRKP